jgi:hypothetical protein
MAIKYSDLYASSSAVGTSSGAISTSSSNYSYIGPSFERAGQPVAFEGTVTVSAALATGDKIYLFDVPKNFRLSYITHQWGDLDGGTDLDMDLGLITQNPDAYINAGSAYQSADTTVSSGTGANFLSEMLTEVVYDEATTTDADVVGFTVNTGAASLGATTTITFRAVGYVV